MRPERRGSAEPDVEEYTLVRSRRRTIALQMKPDGRIVVRAPLRMARRDIDAFVERHRGWIRQKRARLEEALQNRRVISEEERSAGKEAARRYIPQRVAYFAERMGVSYGKITIREQKTRWGSCSSAGNLNFNWKLMLMPREVLDYVVVHELAHRREMNHSARFWAIVEEVLPDYRERRAALREWSFT